MKILVALLLGMFCISVKGQVEYNGTSSVILHGGRKLNKQLMKSPSTIDFSVLVKLDKELGEESFQISKPENHSLTVTGGDDVGVMYGLLDLAEQLGLNGHDTLAIRLNSGKPQFPFRAIKFNTPWSAYRTHPALTQHWETARDLNYWESFLDMMVENRFNVLSLWSIHPFTYMIRPNNFPEACSSITPEESAEWEVFYKTLFKMAKDRGIETYVVWWNIFVSPDFARAHDMADYSVDLQFYGEGENNELIDRYNKECVTQLIDTYDDLSGVGISLGERMLHIDAAEREQWVLDVVVPGMRDAKRKVKFIHRAPFTKHAEITREGIESLTDLPQPIWVEYKFNASHGHSSTQLHRTHGAGVNDAYWNPTPTNHKMVWMMRNEDFTTLRWGQSDFIREHIQNNGQQYVGGYIVGSETYIPAKAYQQKRPDNRINWTYAFEREWLFYKQWGRLTYDPHTPNSLFISEFASRYGEEAAPALYEAVTLAGKIPLQIAAFFAGGNDPSLTVEHFMDGKRSGKNDKTFFIGIDEFIDHQTLDPKYFNIADYVKHSSSGMPIAPDRITPLDVASETEQTARVLQVILGGIKAEPGPIDYEIADALAWSHLGLYFAEKIRGAVALQSYRLSGDRAQQALAVEHLELALKHWSDLADVTDEVYPEFLSTKLIFVKDDGLLSWRMLLEYVKADLDLARSDPGPGIQ